jgi:Na+-transporting methylmalonyl-CoA/oxaloacetate decarboxylase gamma subunit
MTSLSHCLLAAMTLGEKLLDACTLAVVGMGTVFLSLWVIGEIFALLQSFFVRRDERGAAVSEAQAIDIKQELSLHPDPDHLIPILVAAVTAAAGRRVVLKRVTFINRDTVSGWTEAGRTSIHLSHNLLRKS